VRAIGKLRQSRLCGSCGHEVLCGCRQPGRIEAVEHGSEESLTGICCQTTPSEDIGDLVCAVVRSQVCRLAAGL
jgi:hypothetical protein